MSNLVDHAQRELNLLRDEDNGRSGDGTDEMQDQMDLHIINMVELFANEGHSGFSASYAVKVLERLLRFEPVSPLTGEDWEWNEVPGGGDLNSKTKWQNNRCPHVFKREDGLAYDADAVIYVDDHGSAFTSVGSARPVRFPYTPHQRRVTVIQSGRSHMENYVNWNEPAHNKLH